MVISVTVNRVTVNLNHTAVAVANVQSEVWTSYRVRIQFEFEAAHNHVCVRHKKDDTPINLAPVESRSRGTMIGVDWPGAEYPIFVRTPYTYLLSLLYCAVLNAGRNDCAPALAVMGQFPKTQPNLRSEL